MTTEVAKSELKQTEVHTSAAFMAAGASFMLPGLGHLLARRPVRGLIFLAPWIAAFVMGFKFLANVDTAHLVPTTVLVILIISLLSSIDTFIVARRSGVVAGACPLGFSAGTLLLAAVVFVWVLIDTKPPAPADPANPPSSFAKYMDVLLHTIPGMMAVGTASAGILLTVMALFGRKNAALAAAVRLGLMVLIPALLFWPIDKFVQKTILGMDAAGTIKIVIVRDVSMEPSAPYGAWVVLYPNSSFTRLDTVALAIPDKQLEWTDPPLTKIKRIYGLPNEELEISGGALFIDREEFPLPPWTPTLSAPPNAMRTDPAGGPGHMIRLGADEYYVLGDNLAESYDSRYALPVPGTGLRQPGAIPKEIIRGRIPLSLWPLRTIKGGQH